MKVVSLALVLLTGLQITSAQTVFVNADGSHSVGFVNGNSIIAVNANGSHSPGMINGNTAVIVNADGSHSVAFINDPGFKWKDRLEEEHINTSESYYKTRPDLELKRKLKKLKRSQYHITKQKQYRKASDK